MVLSYGGFNGVRMRGIEWLALTVAFALFGAGCNCSPESARLSILEPESGVRLTVGTDTNPDLPGIQAQVVVEAERLGVDELVSLVLNGRDVLANVRVEDDTRLVFDDVTFPAGTHELTAQARGGLVRSEPISIIVEDGCALIDFIQPMDPGGGMGRLTLGPADNTTGLGCDSTFETTFVISTDQPEGTEARIFVNGTPRRTGMVSASGAVRFEGVALDNRGETPNNVFVEVTRADGAVCRQDFPLPIHVNCEGPSCAITQPDTGSAYLNMFDDTSDEDGFQTDFEVTTDASGLGQPVRLIVDGNESGARSANPTPSGMGGVASFGNVSLAEGTRRVQAECRDAVGNVTRSGVAEWIVDITPCDISIASPTEDQLITDDDDLDPEEDGIQIASAGSSAGADCTGIRVDRCSSIDGADFTADGAGEAWERTVTLGSTATQTICAEVRDEAGNIGRAEVGVRVRTDAPQLEIVTPTTGSRFNRLGTEDSDGITRIAALDPDTNFCEAEFVVNCTDVGVDVVLRRQDTMATIPGGTAPCVASDDVPMPYRGQATFDSVSLPTVTGQLTVVARQTVESIVGLSDPITLRSDCIPPELSIGRSMCGSTLRPAQDEQPGVDGLQYRVDVFNTNVPKPPVTLRLIDDMGGNVYGPEVSSTPASGPTTQFPNADFSAGGPISINACAIDAAGNEGCNPSCVVTVEDIPTLSITNPLPAQVLGAEDDCDPGTMGFQLRVRATTDAPDGSDATIRVGTADPQAFTVSGGVIEQCVDAADGSGIPVQVTVTDVRGTAMASVTVTIDSQPPTDAIDDLEAILPAEDRRGGVVRFQWTAVGDTDGSALAAYHFRCAISPIVDESAWDSASVRTLATPPGAAGTMQSGSVAGFRLGVEYYCALRGADAAGQLTPLDPATDPIVNEPLTLELTATGSTDLGLAMAPIGDVNGSGFNDLLVGATGGSAYLYFGSAAGPSTTPDVEILGASGSAGNYGRTVAGLGDINGDGRPDFAIGARALNPLRGAVYVFFGRADSNPWPSVVDLGAGGCQADLCFNGTEDPALFGWSIQALGDFDGDGVQDFAVGAWQASSPAGRVYVILGDMGFTSGTTYDIPGDLAAGPRGFVVAPPMDRVRFGIGLAAPGDLNGDGRADLIASASGQPTPMLPGAIFAIQGRAYPAAGMGLQLISSGLQELATGAAGNFGTTLRAVGDIDGDGQGDIAVYNGITGNAGQVLVYLRRSQSYSSADVLTYSNGLTGQAGDLYGTTMGLGRHPWLGMIGDFDGDGRSDMLIGSAQRGTEAGSVELFYSSAVPASRARDTADLSFHPEPHDLPNARTAQYAGDLNGDGFTDVLVGAQGDLSGAGRVYVFY